MTIIHYRASESCRRLRKGEIYLMTLVDNIILELQMLQEHFFGGQN